MDWRTKAEQLKFEQNKSWGEIATELAPFFPELDHRQVWEKIRGYIRGTKRYKDTQSQPIGYKSTIEIHADGRQTSDTLIKMTENQSKDVNFLLKAHGYDVNEWELVSARSNIWNAYSKKDGIQTLYASKITVKPRKQGLTFEDIDKHFAKMDRQYKPPKITRVKRGNHLMAEVNIADLHLGKLCWQGDTGNNFDYKIARDTYYRIINDICSELQGKPIDYITFVWANDFFNSDTITKTTTAGTIQDTDIRWQKLFNTGVEMLVGGIDLLSQIAPVKTFYTASNHDEVTGYHALQYLSAWYRSSNDVEIDTSAMARKYLLYGNTLLGFTHGNKEKPRNLSMLMPNEAKEQWSKAKYHEMHTAHLHSEHAIEELNGVIVRRISSPTATDTYHYESGYIGAVRKAQTFLYDRDKGLIQIINTPV